MLFSFQYLLEDKFHWQQAIGSTKGLQTATKGKSFLVIIEVGQGSGARSGLRPLMPQGMYGDWHV